VSSPEPRIGEMVVASAEVLDELTGLRQHDGLTMRKIRDHCPAIKSLPLTQRELERRSLHETDLHVAAYEAIKCAVTALVPRTDFSRILARTLNVTGEEGSTLETRRTRLQTELYLTEKAYRRREEVAFTHLAGAMVAAKESPCADPDKPEQLDLDIHVTATASQLLEILNLCTFEDRTPIRVELQRTLTRALPNGARTLLPSVGSSEPVADRLIKAILRNIWPRKLSVGGQEVFLEGESLDMLLFGSTGGRNERNIMMALRERERAISAEHRPDPAGVMLDVVYDEFHRRKKRSLSGLVDSITYFETTDRWIELFPGSSAPIPSYTK
jgi:hypothetical protein